MMFIFTLIGIFTVVKFLIPFAVFAYFWVQGAHAALQQGSAQ